MIMDTKNHKKETRDQLNNEFLIRDLLLYHYWVDCVMMKLKKNKINGGVL